MSCDRLSSCLNRASRAWLASIAIAAFAAMPQIGHAHQQGTHVEPAPALAASVQITGRLEAMTVITAGVIRQYPFLVIADGQRYQLENAGAGGAGSMVTITGKLAKRTITVESVRGATSATTLTPRSTQRGELTGTIRVFHVDYPDGTTEFGYAMFADGGKRNVIDFGVPLPGIENGARAKVSGPVDAQGYVSVDTIEISVVPLTTPQPKATAAATTGYTVFALKFPNETTVPVPPSTYTYPADPFATSTVNTNVFGAAPTKSVAEYYKEVSFGAQLLNGVTATAAGGNWLLANTPKPTACSSNAELNAVLDKIETSGQAAAQAAGFNPNAFPGQFYVVNALPCGWAGLGYIGFPLAYSKGTASLLVIGHEMGHNFGLYHAGSVDCGANVIAPSGCTVTEYGDPWVIMGNNQAGHLNAYQKGVLNYIPGGVATHSTGSQTYTLGPIESPSQSLYAVQIPTSNNKRTYWIEFRQGIGFDAGLPNIGALGAQVRLSLPFENNCCSGTYDDTQFLDMTPGTASFTDGALLNGQTYTDSLTNVTIQVTAATSSALTVQVTTPGGGAATTTTLASNNNPSTQGQSVTFTASVAGTNPTGSATFKDGSTTICNAVALAGSGNTRTAQCTTSALAAGVHSMTATYSGDGSNNSSTSSALSQNVKASTTTSVASSANPSTSGASVTFTATVTGSAPTGNVSFTSDAAGIAGCGAQALSGSGNSRTATCTTSALTVATHSIVASYVGDGANGASTSAPLSQVVNSGAPAPTTTTLGSSANPSTSGASVTFTATVNGTAPTGNVAFTSDAASITGCTAQALTGSGNSRTATCTTNALTVGTHSIVASYAGNAGNASSTSAPLSQVVNSGAPAPTTTTLGSSANPSTSGASVTFTATVNGTAPTGNVAFTSDAANITGCTAQALSGSGNSRTATCTTSALTVGTHSIAASYAGNASNAPSTSAPLSQVVNGGGGGPTATTTTLGSSANPSTSGASVTFTATVNGNVPTGNVAFTSDAANISGCTAQALSGSGNSRTATCTTNALTVGTHSVVASYAGNAGNTPSTSAPLSQVVSASNLAPTTTLLDSTHNPSPAGASVALVATVVASPPVQGGMVAFTANGAQIASCANVPVVALTNERIATCNANLPSGAYSVVASYGGDQANQPSTSFVFSQVVSFAAIGNTVQFASAGYSVNETNGSVMITVTRIGDASAPAQVSYDVVAGSAAPGADYTPSSGVLVWAANDATDRTITVPIADDGVGEGNETFALFLSNPVGAALGTTSGTTVTIFDDENALAAMPGIATVVNNPYGTPSLVGGTLQGNTISSLSNNAVIQLGSVAGTPGSFAKIDFQGLDIGTGNTLTIRSGAAGQTVYLTNVNGSAAAIAGTLLAQGGNGAAAPRLVVQSTPGLTIANGGLVRSASGVTLDTLGATLNTGGDLVNQGTVDGGLSLVLKAARVNGGGAFFGNATSFATFGNLNNPANGPHFVANGLQLYPSTGTSMSVALAGYGASPQVMNLMMHGDATLSMPSAWPGGSTLPSNNRPVMPAEVRAAGVGDPPFGGGSMILQASGNLTLDGGASNDFVFPGGVVFIAGTTIDVHGVAVDNGWTTSGAAFQGVFFQAPDVIDTLGVGGINVRTNNLNWANFSARPNVPVHTWTLQQQGNGTSSFAASDSLAPHLNFYSIVSEAGAAGQCYPCLVNGQVMNFSVAP